MRKRWPIAVVLAAAVIALVWLLAGGGGGRKRAGATGGSNDGAGAHGGASAHAARDRHGGDPASLAGTVRDDTGAPIAGAWVCASPGDDDLSDEQDEPRCTTTAADGGWKLAGLFAGAWGAYAGAEGLVPAQWRDADKDDTIDLHAGEARAGIDFALGGGGVLVEGTVLDLTGGPIEGARVTIGGGWGGDRGWCMTRSGADGAFRCWVAPGSAWGWASADGYADGWTDLDAPAKGVEILLTPESTLDGTVVRADTHEPVAGARVALGGEWGSSYGRTVTDAEGHFHAAYLAPGRYKPTATAPGLYGEAVESVLVGIAQGRDGIVIEVHPAATVRGTVLLDGKPVDDCTVSLAGAGDEQYVDRTDDDGVVELDAVQPGTYHVSLECEKEARKEEYPPLVVADQPVETTWEVLAGATLTGVVVDADGAPVARATVAANREGDAGWWGGDSATTEPDGTFELTGLSVGPAKLQVMSEDHPAPEKPIPVEIGKDHDVRIELPAGGGITGRVHTASGAPVVGVDVRADRSGQDFWGGNGKRTREDGSFTLEGLRPGEYRVGATREWRPLRKPGTTDDDPQGEKATVTAGKTARVEIVVEDPSGQISGKVLDQNGEPVGDAFLRAERESDAAGAQADSALSSARWSWVRKPAVTATDGTFTITGLSPGKYTVLAYRKGGSEAKQQGVALGASVTLTIERVGSLSGTVTSPDGPPRSVMINLQDGRTGYQRSERFFFSGGRWTMRDLPAGSYDIAVLAPEGKGKLDDVVLGAGEDRSGVDLALAPTVDVTGRLVDAQTREPVKGVQVFITAIGGPFSITAADMEDKDHVSGDDGRFTVHHVATGKTGLIVFPSFTERDSKYTSIMRNIDVEGTGTVDLGDIAMRASRLPPDTEPGDLGFTLTHYPPDTNPADVALKVASVRAGGPAAAAGLQVGDVIVSVDGTDVRGDNTFDYYTLAHVPPGTTLTFGLERGATVTITAGPPR